MLPPADTEELLQQVNKLQEQLELKNANIQVLNRTMTGLHLKNKRLQNELMEEAIKDPTYKEVEGVLLFWRPRCMPRAKIIPASPRWNKTRDRLVDRDIEGKQAFTPEDLCEAVEGACLSEYHVKHHYLDAVTIFRDANTVESHRDRLSRAKLAAQMAFANLPGDLFGQSGGELLLWLSEQCDCGHLRAQHWAAAETCTEHGCGCELFNGLEDRVHRFLAERTNNGDRRAA